MNDKTLDLIQKNIYTISKQIPGAAKSAHEIAIMYVKWSSLLEISTVLLVFFFSLLGAAVGAFFGSKDKIFDGSAEPTSIGLGAVIGLVIGMSIGVAAQSIIHPIFYYLNPDFGIIDMIIRR